MPVQLRALASPSLVGQPLSEYIKNELPSIPTCTDAEFRTLSSAEVDTRVLQRMKLTRDPDTSPQHESTVAAKMPSRRYLCFKV